MISQIPYSSTPTPLSSIPSFSSLIPRVHAESPDSGRGTAGGEVLGVSSGRCRVPAAMRGFVPKMVASLKKAARFVKEDLPQPPNAVFTKWFKWSKAMNLATQQQITPAPDSLSTPGSTKPPQTPQESKPAPPPGGPTTTETLPECVTGDTKLRRRRKRKVKSEKGKVEGDGDPDATKKSACADSLTDLHTSVVAPSLSEMSVSNEKQDVKGVDPRGVAPLPPGLTNSAPHWRGPTPESSISDSDWEDVRIDQVEEGEQILTLDEKTGQFVASRVNKLMRKGIQQIYGLKTASGKYIKTTSTHPYLVQTKQPTAVAGTFDVDISGRIEEMNKDSFIALANHEAAYVIAFSAREKRTLLSIHRKTSTTRFGFQVYAFLIADLIRLSGFKPEKLRIDHDYEGNEPEVKAILSKYMPGIAIEFTSIGHGSPADAATYQANTRGFGIGRRFTVREYLAMKKETKGAFAPNVGHQAEWIQSFAPTARSPKIAYYGSAVLSRAGASSWVKVSDLHPGVKIATVDGWEYVISIDRLDRREVFDIEVSGTHNFVGNGIVAHNTSIPPSNNEAQRSVQKANVQQAQQLIDSLENVGRYKLAMGVSSIIDILTALDQLANEGQWSLYASLFSTAVSTGVIKDVDYITSGLDQLAKERWWSYYANLFSTAV